MLQNKYISTTSGKEADKSMMKIFKVLEDREKLDRKKVFNNSHNTRAIGCQMKLQYVITL